MSDPRLIAWCKKQKIDPAWLDKVKIGLEIHVQLPTKSKMFCSCPTTDAEYPNSHVCPTCLGMPGSRPVMNKQAMIYGIMLAKMLGCTVADTTWFSRKIYFYPDMSKEIQITQYDNPVGEKGAYVFNGRTIGITRIHLEEDPGKTKRVGDLSSLIDYNRSGIPLAEIVTEPDLKDPLEAREFLKSLINDIRATIDLPNDGERSIRCDCNISVGSERCEIKNVTGLENMQSALMFEMYRHIKLQMKGEQIKRATRRYDEEKKTTVHVRFKEFEADYGYIDEPDLGIFHIKELADSITIKESPKNRTARMCQQYGIQQKMSAQLVTTSSELCDLFELVAGTVDVQNAVKWVAGPVSANWKHLICDISTITEDILARIVAFSKGELTDVACGAEIKSLMTGIESSIDAGAGGAALDEMINTYLDENPGIIADYVKNDKAVNKLIGHVMKTSGGRYASGEVVETAKRLIESRI